MSEIIPAIIAKDFNELKEKIKLVERRAKTVQLDVMDGIFVSDKTWPLDSFLDHGSGLAQGKPSVNDLEKLETNLFLEAHLMVDNPHRVLNEWLNSKVGRVILHWEAIEKIHNHEILPYKTQVGAGFPISNLAQEAHRNNKEFGVALNLETPITVLNNFISEIDMVLLMSVKPGQGGQKFEESVIPKIILLRQKYPDVKIGVDGGVNKENILKLAEAGAGFLVVGSAIFADDDPAKALEDFKKII
ncbi:MAG: ribulose-phosphate 3-epimerase [Candidatus Portnoybacteria bacterium]|nr:ribulose-phosphate 3-epimerase [Candidatus Portnoybacteria bacterium]MDD4982938.1 ribulose-phosphate 3-epimerase [Candidatus Portnoybacteria bacterium]